MKHKKYLFFSLLSCFLISRVIANVASIHIDRSREVIRVEAEDLSLLLGEDIQSFKLYRYLSSTDTWEPVPFQIDIPDGFSYSSKKSGVLEAGDQILFMAKDLGDKASLTQWVDEVEAGGNKRTCLLAVDPLTQDSGRIYVYQSSNLVGSDSTYLCLDETDDRVESADYVISHGQYGLQNSILFKSSAGGDNIDFFDTQKLRFKIRIIVDLGIFGKIKKTVTITEETRNKTITIAGFPVDISFKDLSTEYSCTGTIRLQRLAIFEISVDADGIGVHESSKLYLTSHFFPHYTEWRADEITIPEFDEGKIKMMRFSADLNENSVGMIFYNPYNISGIRIDGESSSVDQTIAWGYNWYLIHADPEYNGSQLTTGSILSIMDLKGKPLGDEQELWFRDDASEDNDDTGDEKSYGDVGVRIEGSSISGELSFLNRTYYIPDIVSYSQAEQEIEKDRNPIETNVDSEYPLHITTVPPEGGQVQVIAITDTTFGQRQVTLTAFPFSNYVFDHWSMDASGEADTVQIYMDSPKYVTAHFIRLRDITVTTDPSGLDFTADGEIYSSPYLFTWQEGSTHKLAIDSLIQSQEDTRYIFSQWSTGESRNFDYTVPQGDEEVIGEFITEFRVYTSVNLEEAGFIVLSPPGEWFEKAMQVKFEAFPQGWYTFIRWGGDIDNHENPITVSVDSSLTVQAVFGNYPPVVTLPDTSFNEDDTLTLNFSFFNQAISDENNPDSTLKVRFQDSDYLGISSDSSLKTVKIFSKNRDWYGRDSLTVTAEDPLQETGSDHLVMEVYPVNDTPLPFSLLEPANDAEVTGCADSIHFSWQEAVDPDPEDKVTYVFKLDTTQEFNSLFLIKKVNIDENNYNFKGLDSLENFLYYWQVTARDTCDSTIRCKKIFSFYVNLTAVEQTETVPSTFVLKQNYPNPFNHSTVIEYAVPEAEQVEVYIMNSRGQKVYALVDAKVKAGYHTVSWHGTDEQGKVVSSGIYFVVLVADENKLVKKALFLK